MIIKDEIVKCPRANCEWRNRDDGSCIAPIDERVKRHCPIPKDVVTEVTP